MRGRARPGTKTRHHVRQVDQLSINSRFREEDRGHQSHGTRAGDQYFRGNLLLLHHKI